MMHDDEGPGTGLSETVEDYLRLIATLQVEGQLPTVGRLSVSLGVTPASVSGTVSRLVREGLLTTTRHRVILTERGAEAARTIWRRHSLAECFLIDVLKVPWSEVSIEADRLEHTVSTRIERRMQELLGNRTICPHGNPIEQPDVADAALSLATAEAGLYRVVRLRETATRRRDLMSAFEACGIQPGLDVEVIPGSGDGVRVRGRSHDFDFERASADVVLVKEAGPF